MSLVFPIALYCLRLLYDKYQPDPINISGYRTTLGTLGTAHVYRSGKEAREVQGAHYGHASGVRFLRNPGRTQERARFVSD